MNPSPAPQETLPGLSEITLRPSLPPEERRADFLRQIGDPYRFRCGETAVTLRFAEGGPPFATLFEAYLNSL